MEAFLKSRFKRVLKTVSASPRETEKAAAAFVKKTGAGCIAGLIGNLGAGKTCFVKGAAAALGADKGDVVSPTFNIVKEYRCRGNEVIYHFDLYRLETASELEHIGYRDYLYAGAGARIFIEWPENAEAEALKDITHAVVIDSNGKSGRIITVYERKKTQQKSSPKRQRQRAKSNKCARG